MTRMTCRAVPNAPVFVRFADGMAGRASARNRRWPFQFRKRIGGPFHVPRVKFFREFHLLRCKSALAKNRGPRWRRMPASYKLLINLLVAHATICRRDVGRNLKSVVFDLVLFLAVLRLMTIETGHALRCVLAHFKFMNN